ncbi:MAG: DUF805 domain-containing protein [Gammaproteobacteria bacterium]
MLQILFGDIKKGRLTRLPYLIYSLLFNLVVIGIGIGVVLSIGAGEQIINGEIQQAQQKILSMFSGPLLLIFLVVTILLVFSWYNLMAKRIRDIGIPGWWAVLAIVILESIISVNISGEASSGMHTLIWIVLLLIPSNTFEKTIKP